MHFQLQLVHLFLIQAQETSIHLCLLSNCFEKWLFPVPCLLLLEGNSDLESAVLLRLWAQTLTHNDF